MPFRNEKKEEIRLPHVYSHFWNASFFSHRNFFVQFTIVRSITIVNELNWSLETKMNWKNFAPFNHLPRPRVFKKLIKSLRKNEFWRSLVHLVHIFEHFYWLKMGRFPKVCFKTQYLLVPIEWMLYQNCLELSQLFDVAEVNWIFHRFYAFNEKWYIQHVLHVTYCRERILNVY